MSHRQALEESLSELVSAEDFLEFFAVPFDPHIVQTRRLHILQRFHDYLARQADNLPEDGEAQRAVYRLWLERAYLDFVESDPLTEKVFRVFQHAPLPGGGMSSFVSLDKVFQS